MVYAEDGDIMGGREHTIENSKKMLLVALK